MVDRPFRTSVASRERNRIHARKTRLRKKEQMQTLQDKADDLKSRQIRLKQVINEKHTASILVRLFAKSGDKELPGGGLETDEDPLVEELLRRPTSDIPDSTNISELPSLILPGQHASKKLKDYSSSTCEKDNGLLEVGIDYGLLGKDRAKCTPEELDQIRRERNRMHAKRTRDRKRMFMEELSDICRKLEDENDMLRDHLHKIDPDYVDEEECAKEDDHSSVDDFEETREEPTPLTSSFAPLVPRVSPKRSLSLSKKSVSRQGCVDQIHTLLEVATSFDRSSEQKRALVAVSSDDSNDESTVEDPSLRLLVKRRRVNRTTPSFARPMASA